MSFLNLRKKKTEALAPVKKLVPKEATTKKLAVAEGGKTGRDGEEGY